MRAILTATTVLLLWPAWSHAQTTRTNCDYGSTVRRGTIECTTRTTPTYTNPWNGFADAFTLWAQAQEQRNQQEAYTEYMRQQTALLAAQNRAHLETRRPTLTVDQIWALPSKTLTDETIYGGNLELKVAGLVELIRRIGPEFYPEWTSQQLWDSVARYGAHLERMGVYDLPMGGLLRGFVHFANAEYKK